MPKEKLEEDISDSLKDPNGQLLLENYDCIYISFPEFGNAHS